MSRCNCLCTKDATGTCALCDVLAERDVFVRRWLKGGCFVDGFQALRRKLSGSSSFWTPVGGGLTLLATLVIAAATVINTCTADKQWNVMDRQLRVMEYAQRPWLGASQTQFKHGSQPSMIQPERKVLTLHVMYLIKNFGLSPALAVNMEAIFQLPYEPVDNESVKERCQQVEHRTQDGIGQVIFPGSDFSKNDTLQEHSPPYEDLQALPSVSIRICIFYRDTAHQMHHTKIWLLYTPSTGLQTVDQEAT